MSAGRLSNSSGDDRGLFQSTHWSVVLAASEDDADVSGAALAALCRAYWLPVYAFVRKRGYNPEQAEDLTQGFFAEFLEKESFNRADPQRGRFRGFLTASVANYLNHERVRASAQKRGSGVVPFSLDWKGAEDFYDRQLEEEENPARAMEKAWVRSLLNTVMGELRAEYEKAGKLAFFEQIQRHLWGESDSLSYTELARQLDLSLSNVKVGALRLRLRFRELLRGEVMQTVASEADLDDEIRYLMAVLGE